MVNPIDVWIQFICDWNESGQKKIMRNYPYHGGTRHFVNQLRNLSLTFKKDVEIKAVGTEIQIRII